MGDNPFNKRNGNIHILSGILALKYFISILFLVLLLAGINQSHAKRLFFTGFELVGGGIGGNSPDGIGTMAFGGGTQGGGRTGNGLLQQGNGTNHQYAEWISTGTVTPSFYVRIWCKTGSTPPLNNTLFNFIDNATNTISGTWLTSTGKVTVKVNGTTIGTTATSLSNKGFFLIKISSNWATSSASSTITIDTAVFTTNKVFTSPDLSLIAFAFGFIDAQTTPGSTLQWDDLAINDSQGRFENTAPEDSATIYVCKPTSDDVRGSWTAGGGATTNLYKGVYHAPLLAASLYVTENDTTNIKNSNSSATDNYKVFLQDYTTAGLASNKGIKVLQAYCRTGEHAASGTEAGGLQLLSNPSGHPEFAFNFGNDLGAHGTEDTITTTHWYTTFDSVYYGQEVDQIIIRSQSPEILVGRRTANTNQVCVDWIGIQFEAGTKNGYVRRHHF